MKIAFILSSISNHGPFIVAQNIINNIYNEVDAIDIYYLKEPAEKLDYKANCIKVKLFSTTDFSGYDVVHSHGFLGDMYAHFNKKSINGKRITTLHQDIKTDYMMKYNWLTAVTLEKFWCYLVSDSSYVVTLTQQMVKYYQDKLSMPLTYVYNGIPEATLIDIPTDEQQKILALKAGYKVMGIAAFLIYRKGIDQVIKAMALEEGKQLALVVLGEGEKRDELLELARELGVADRCLFLGYKKHSINYFKYFDLYMMSSRSEGFGLCVVEAASQKIPLVCANLPVYDELFDNEEVVKFQSDDVASLCKAANTAIANSAQLSQRIYKKYLDSYTAKAMAQNYLTIYKKVAASNIL